MRNAYVIGAGMTRFEKSRRRLKELVVEAVTQALALNPPPADAAPTPAPAELVQPVQIAKPVAPLNDPSAVKVKEPLKEKDIIAAERKPDRKVVERKQAIARKEKVLDEEEPNPEPPRVSGEPDRPTREGF